MKIAGYRIFWSQIGQRVAILETQNPDKRELYIFQLIEKVRNWLREPPGYEERTDDRRRP